MSPSSRALAFRMWRAAEPRGWDMTLAELADEIGEPIGRVRRVAQLSRWLTRFRSTLTDPANYAGISQAQDDDLDAMGLR